MKTSLKCSNKKEVFLGYARCKVCGHIFEKQHPGQKVCMLWEIKGKKSYKYACQLHMSRVRNVRNYQNSAWRGVKLSTGCVVKRKQRGRCEKWLECANKTTCLREIPNGWPGFEAVDDKGYEPEDWYKEECT